MENKKQPDLDECDAEAENDFANDEELAYWEDMDDGCDEEDEDWGDSEED